MKYQINLFPKKELNVADKLIYFTFHYLRYILVLTQLVVIGVFFYRFRVDQEIVDLKETLHQKQEIVAISQPLLTEAGVVDKKIQYISQLTADQENLSLMFNYLLSIFPEKLILSHLQLEKQTLTLEGTTGDANTVKIFYNRLKREKKFQSVILRGLKKKDAGYDFTFELKNFKAK